MFWNKEKPKIEEEKPQIQETGPEGVDEHNLDMLNKDMQELLMGESLGGNAGFVEIEGKKYSCAAANGYVNPETGKIVAFGNIQDVPPEIVRRNIPFTLKVAFGMKQGGYFKIMEVISSSEKFSANCRPAIQSAVDKWNAEHGK